MAVLFPVNMNNRGQNVLSVREKFHQLSREPSQVEFVGYHFRPSGNFLFIDSGDGIVEAAVKIGKTVIGLPCLARKFSELENIFNAVPANTKVTERGSVFLDTSSGLRKLIYVALS